eukprot:CAMPEP_0115038808 /NCGR_PEP_ID=MMETSP0216-20121206/43635_1 /TAXON_ID=223996 /ORGANISM="Protocruzia adherens, Strain Boccale" /LENGTH=271 /DNA_ID=CAMNT_0002419291 /DNA_START=54 /DNA_END=869 /DNA_ORIENTATION=+
MAAQDLRQSLAQFQSLVDSAKFDVSSAAQKLVELKQGLMKLTSLPPSVIPAEKEELLVARDVYEAAVLYSVKAENIEEFDKNITQLKSYYSDFQNFLPDSAQMFPMLGLNLLYLLSYNKMSEFHTELESIPVSEHGNIYIKPAILLEQYLMEGNYSKVLSENKNVPLEHYRFFTDRLVHTIREEVAMSAEKAYESVSLDSAKALFFVDNREELLEFIRGRQDRMEDDVEVEWKLEGEKLHFVVVNKETLKIPSKTLIDTMLTYTSDIESIV